VAEADKLEFLTVAEVAEILRLSPDSVSRRFENRAGVLDLGRPEELHRRRYRQLRISRRALNEFISEVSEQ
jgi:hypothetical protein